MKMKRIDKINQRWIEVREFFESSQETVFSRKALEYIFTTQSNKFGFPESYRLNEFIEELETRGIATKTSISFGSWDEIRYLRPSFSLFELATSLRPSGYFSHSSALWIHNLTESLPKTFYINSEQPGRSNPNSRLSQAKLDYAFRRPQRLSNASATIGGFNLVSLHGQNTERTGIIRTFSFDPLNSASTEVPVSSLERTLIDCTVRPYYAGGPFEVARAFETAAEQLSVNRLVAYLNQIEYVYPYHQAIGFYLERTGKVSSRTLDLLRTKPVEFDFYLTHEMEDPDYIEEWRLFVPHGF
jgi:predicted transcriptional regulator of viral defense system